MTTKTGQPSKQTSIERSIGGPLSSLRYNKPEKQDMAVVLAFFNPVESFRIIQNLYTVKQMLELANIPVFIGEIAYKEKPFVLPSSPNVYQYRTSSLMFYKENIMTQVVRRVPSSFTKILLLDADILFLDINWYDKVSAALDTHDVVQPFFNAFQLDITFYNKSTKQSILSNGYDLHEGYAWAFQRKWLEAHPLFEYAVVGGGDTILYNNVTNDIKQYSKIDVYKNDMPYTIKDNVRYSYVDITIAHLHHGSMMRRRYASQSMIVLPIMKRFAIHKLSDMLYRTDDDIFEWKPEYRELVNEEFSSFFRERFDDGI